MKLKKKLLKKSQAYIIIDKETCANRPVSDIANKIKKSAVDIVQYRDKKSTKETILETALKLRKIFSNTKTLFIINDYLDIAKIVDSDGIHLGQNDTSLKIARSILGKNKLIGISCHSLKQAKIAQKNGADYISIGPIFPTTTKPEYKPIGLNLINRIKYRIKIPFFAIGGINVTNLNKVLSYGAKRAVVCSAVCQAKDIALKIKRISRILNN